MSAGAAVPGEAGARFGVPPGVADVTVMATAGVAPCEVCAGLENCSALRTSRADGMTP